MRARKEEECQEPRKLIECMSERQRKLLCVMDPKRNLMSEAPEELRTQIFPEIRGLDEKISDEEMELLERRMILEEWLKEGRNAEVQEERAEVIAGGGVIRQAVAASRSSEAEVELRLADVDGRRGTEDTVVAGVASVGRKQLCLKALEPRVISLQ